MESKFTIFVVYIVAVQSSLAVLPMTAAPRIQDEYERDFTILRAYKVIVVHQLKKGIQLISAVEHQAYSARGGAQDNNPAEHNSHTIETCKDEISSPMVALIGAAMAAILVVDPEAFLAVANTQTLMHTRMVGLAEDICLAITLATGGNSSEVAARFEEIADGDVSGFVTFNAAYFGVLKNRYTHSKVELAIQNAERKATAALMSGIHEIFNGIETLISSGIPGDSQDIRSVLEITNSRALSGIIADTEIKFGLLESLLTASCVIQFDNIGCFSATADIEESTPSDCEQSVTEKWPIDGGDSLEVSDENQGDDQCETGTENCDIRTAREASDYNVIEGSHFIFNTIKNELVKARSRENSTFQNDFEATREKVTDILLGWVNATMDAILAINLKAPSEVRTAMYAAGSRAKESVDHVFAAISLIEAADFSRISIELEALENAANSASLATLEHIYDAIRIEDASAEIQTTIERDQYKSMSEFTKVAHAFSNRIRISIAHHISGTKITNERRMSSSEFAHTESSIAVKVAVQAIFHAMQTVYRASAIDRDEMIEILSVIEFYREIAISKIILSNELIFEYVSAVEEVSSTGETNTVTESNDIKTGNTGTISTWRILVILIFCAIPSNNPEASAKKLNKAISMIEDATNNVYQGIAATQNNNSFRTLTELQALEEKTAESLRNLTLIIFAEIREGREFDAQTSAAIDRLQENTLSSPSSKSKNIFNAIRILLAATCSGVDVENEDSLSSVEFFSERASDNNINWVRNIFESIELL